MAWSLRLAHYVASALRELHGSRAVGRYADQDLVLPDQRLGELLDVAEEMIDSATAAIGPRLDQGPEQAGKYQPNG